MHRIIHPDLNKKQNIMHNDKYGLKDKGSKKIKERTVNILKSLKVINVACIHSRSRHYVT